MKTRLSIFILALFAVALSIVGFAGCSEVKSGAEDVQYITGEADSPSTQPTSQPTAHDETVKVVHDVVQIVKTVSPPLAPIISLVGVLAGLVAGVAGHSLGTSSATKKGNSILSEIVSDIASYKEPGKPWTETTQSLLQDLGYAQAAITEPLSGT